ncbi:hypothetical protein FQA47_009899 [Oryzias melastigma]|uniref:Secreted protein n=1 Tax=Oryzias melastigma TaxID=30732 RepID=A0A834FFD1_ORYME|nr:hypothetical protein FQA47_009899 [Oryzias melastigma]
MKALLLLVLPWLSPANYTDNLGNLHILYSELLASVLSALISEVFDQNEPLSLPVLQTHSAPMRPKRISHPAAAALSLSLNNADPYYGPSPTRNGKQSPVSCPLQRRVSSKCGAGFTN